MSRKDFEYSYRGKAVEVFESALRERIKTAEYILATNTGTSALHLCLIAAGVGPGDEVLCPSLTFAGTAAAIMYTGARPNFYDVNLAGVVDAGKLDKYLENGTGRIKSIVTVNLLGQNINTTAIREICMKHNLFWIEDAAAALGTFDMAGNHAGTVGDCGIISFNGNKIITTGGGGCLMTNNPTIYTRAKHRSMTAKIQGRGNYHDQVGYNYRMPALNAMMGIKRLSGLNRKIAENRRIAEQVGIYPDYNCWGVMADIIQDIKGTEILPQRGNYFWQPLHTLPPYADCNRDNLEITEHIYQIKCWIGG